MGDTMLELALRDVQGQPIPGADVRFDLMMLGMDTPPNRPQAADLDLSQKDAEEYLERWVMRCQVAGLGVTTEVSRGDPAAIIVRSARQAKADLTVLGTHGRAGLHAFWAGSVAPQISRHSRVPLLLVPARKPAPAR
jgi:nucleotide-binding universal stress UspA family protein